MFYIVLLICLEKYLLILYFVLFFLLRNEQYKHGHYGATRQELIQAHELQYTSNFDLKDISNF